MKKTLLLFAMLLGVVGAWAQIDLSNPIVTFTNVQKDGTEHILYVDHASQKLKFRTVEESVEATLNELGGYAQFRAITKDGGKVAFYNESTSKYMIWRGSSGGYNGNTGLTDEYNSTYCDWSLTRDIHHEPGTFFICSKRNNGDAGTLIYNKNKSGSDFFDNYSNNIAWESSYSNLFRISGLPVVECVLKDELGTLHEGEIEYLGKPLLNTNYIICNEQWDGSVFKADITFPFAVSDADNANPMIISAGEKSWTENIRKWYADGANIKITHGQDPTLENIKRYLWTVHIDEFKDGEFSFKIKNFDSNTYIYTDQTSSNHASGALVLSEEKASVFNLSSPNKDNKEYYSFFTKSGETYLYLSVGSSGSGTQHVGVNTYQHVGTSITNISCKLNYNLTDKAGNSYTGEYEGWSELQPEPTFTGAEGYTLTDKVWDGNTFTATITFPFLVSSETVSNPTMISSYNYNKQAPDQFKWCASDNKIKVKEGEEIDYSSIASHLWLIYPKFNNGAFTFQIKNVATGLFVNSSVSGNGHDDESTVVLSSEATDFTVGKRGSEGAEFINSFGKRLSVNTSDPNPADKIQTVGTYDTHYGTAVTFPDYMESTTWPEFVSTGTTLNPLVIAIDNDVKKTLVAKKLPSSADRYVHVTASNEEPELGYGQWTIYPAFSGNMIGFKIKNIATETYIYAKPNGASEEYPVVLNADGTAFDFADSKFAYTDGVNTLYLSVPTNESFNLPLGVSAEADDTRKTIAFPEFNSFQVTIGEVGYTTLYSPITVVAIPEEGKEVDIYAITDATTSENNKVTLTKLESWNVIPANQGCILKGSGKIAFSKTDDSWVIGDWSTNLLRGSFTNTYVQGDAYVLSAPDGVESVGLYKAMLNKNENGEAGTTHFKNNAGKAYLPASALSAEAAESRFFLFGFGDGEETGITETENGNVKTENTEVYDLSGRRVQGAQKGIFIVNGKKVVR
ncbi:MAG: hypothetical protein J6S05_02260 [Bacteroidaceae bacterium]|nr:hypothetical protein [Bacteroidaceae bacterium]